MRCLILIFPCLLSAGALALPNPASENCLKQRGTLKIEKRGDGGEYGLCLFEDNRQCEEWALYKGLCPSGGLKVTGSITPQAHYCAITGGKYAVLKVQTKQHPEVGQCELPNGHVCDALMFYNGSCS